MPISWGFPKPTPARTLTCFPFSSQATFLSLSFPCLFLPSHCGDILPPSSYTFLPTAGIGPRWEIDRQVLARTPHRSVWKCPEDGARPSASCWKGTDREGSSEVLSASSPLANLDVFRVFLERVVAVESLLEENCSSKSSSDFDQYW